MEWLNNLDRRLERYDSGDEGQSAVNNDQVVVNKPIHVALAAKDRDDSIGARAFDRMAEDDGKSQKSPMDCLKGDDIGLRAFSRNVELGPYRSKRKKGDIISDQDISSVHPSLSSKNNSKSKLHLPHLCTPAATDSPASSVSSLVPDTTSSESGSMSKSQATEGLQTETFDNFTANALITGDGADRSETIPQPLTPSSSMLVEQDASVGVSSASSSKTKYKKGNDTSKNLTSVNIGSFWKNRIESMVLINESNAAEKMGDLPMEPPDLNNTKRDDSNVSAPLTSKITQHVKNDDESKVEITDAELQQLTYSITTSSQISREQMHGPPPGNPTSGDSISSKQSSVGDAKDDPNGDSSKEMIDLASDDKAYWSDRSIDISAHSSIEEDESKEYEIQSSLPCWDERIDEALDTSLNCQGVVHVRLLRAQRLPCSIGSSIYAIIALPPWKGRVKTERTTAYRGPSESGVCVRWDSLDESGCYSMVHQWNNEDTPIPTITVDMMFSPLQMLDFKVCSLKLPCTPLMRSPGVWTRTWLQANLPPKLAEVMGPSSFGDDPIPMIQLEAVFIPASFDEEEQEETAIGSVETTLPEIPQQSTISRQISRGSSSLASSQLTPRNPTKSHLLMVESFWTPAYCCVCSKIITGWRTGYRCEVCHIDVCNDCQLQVDIQMPCGSEGANAAFDSAIQNRLSVQNMLAMVAPLDPSYETQKTIGKDILTFNRETVDSSKKIVHIDHTNSPPEDPTEGIGILKLNIIRACIFEVPLPPEEDPKNVFLVEDDSKMLRQGDHYVRISWTGNKQSTRTRLIQNTGKPRFDTDEMKFSVPHYGMEYKIEVIDAGTNKPVGTHLLPVQALLQWQRDSVIEEKGFSYFRISQAWNHRVEKKRTMLELRSGVKSGFGADYFISSKTKEASSSKLIETGKPGEIIGWVEVDLCLEEETNALYGQKPLVCPASPPPEFNVDIFQIHIARIAAIIEDIKKAGESYMYIISWKEPALTSLSMIIFFTVGLRFNTEYVGSLPVFFLIMVMFHLGIRRRRGVLKNRFLEREKGARIIAEKKAGVKYTIHRPICLMKISVCRGKNLISPDYGFTGSVGCRIYWDPQRYEENDKVKDAVSAVDKSMSRPHDIGFVNNKYAKHPVWNEIIKSDESRRLNQLLPEHGSFFEEEEKHTHLSSDTIFPSINFPMLQPFVPPKKKRPSDGEILPKGAFRLSPWESSRSAIVVEVRFLDVLMVSRLPGFDDVLGEVSIPVSKLVETGEIKGWFQVLEAGTKATIPCDYDEDDIENPKTSDSTVSLEAQVSRNIPQPSPHSTTFGKPKVYLELRLEPPDSNKSVLDTDREASIVVAEEMIKSAIMSAQQSKIDLIGSSIGAFNTVRGLGGNIQLIQNTLGTVLDIVEKFRNTFNFSDPFKSTALLLVLFVLWLFLALVPTRALVLVAGFAQYAATFKARYGSGPAGNPHDFETNSDQKEKLNNAKVDKDVTPIIAWLNNAFRALPTDEDLRRAYFWESRRIAEQECEEIASQKRVSRLQRLWKAEWYSNIDLRIANDDKRKKGVSGRDWVWVSIFGIIQNRRFLWWQNVQDFDDGAAPRGRIFLAGHAGLAGLSPLDQRELQEDEVPLVTNIFGRGEEGQQKLMLLMPKLEIKENFEMAIVAALAKSD